MATTVAAYGKVKTKAQRGETMPEGWMIDREGKPLTDPQRADEGFLLPIGGYKGYGLALDGRPARRHAERRGDGHGRRSTSTATTATPTNTGQAIVAIDIAAFGDVDGVQGARRHARCATCATSERMPGVERIWLPGEQSHAKRIAYARDGIPLAAAARAQLSTELADELGIAPMRID